jgi:RimJ/RimL family protein N-acetyltransferase
MGSDNLATAVVPLGIPVEPTGYDERVIANQHERVAAWVAAQVGCDAHAWAQYTTLGLEKNGELVAGVVFESFTGTAANIHVAGIGRYWMNRAILFATFDYAFRQLKLKRLTGLVEAVNERALAFDLNLGFEIEARMVDAVPSGDVLILRMTPDNCRFLRG